VADPLALRLPQVQASEAGLRAAQARLREAELRLERTTLRAPFHGRVRAVNVDAGQFVGAGQPIGRIYSIEKAQIVVPVPDEELAWIDVPKMDRQVSSDPVSTDPSPGVASVASEVPTPEPPVTIRARYAGRDHRWEGRILRSEGELDPRSRMVRLVIEVSDPYRWVTPSVPQQGTAEFSPLMVGLFCDVEIRGRTLQNVVSLPRSAIHDGNQVWVATRPGTLRVQSVDVVRTDRERGLVRMVLNEGDRIITSQLRGITDGMRIRVTDDGGRP
jgi:RND family efflux transporter MFP subunit